MGNMRFSHPPHQTRFYQTSISRKVRNKMLTQFIIYLFITRIVESMSCYECVGGKNDRLCSRYTGASCGYGLFGCIKIATYSGGVNKCEYFNYKLV